MLRREARTALALALCSLAPCGCSRTDDGNDTPNVLAATGGGNNCHCSQGADGKFVCDCGGIIFSNGEASASVGGARNVQGTAIIGTAQASNTNSTTASGIGNSGGASSSSNRSGASTSTKLSNPSDSNPSSSNPNGSSSNAASGGAGISANGNGGANANTLGVTRGGSSGVSTATGNTVGGSSGTSSAATTNRGGTTAVTFVVPADAKPTPESSGKPGIFRVNSSGKLTANGKVFQVRGGNWFGLEGQDDVARPGAMELYIGAVFWADAANRRTIEKTMQEITGAPLSLNTIRLPIAPQTLVKGHPDGDYSRTDIKIRNNDPTIYSYADSYEAFEDFLIQANKNNLYVILDIHSCSNHIGWRAGLINDAPPWTDANRENYKYKKEDKTCRGGEDDYNREKWLADIHTLAQLPKKLGIKNILGIDCFNEPFKYSWSDWADLAKECYDAMAAENDDLIAVVEGVSGTHTDESGNSGPEPFGDPSTNPNWGENLYGQQFDPIQIPKDRLCFSPHTYGPAVYVQTQFIDQSDPACQGLEDDAAGKAKCKLVVERTNATAVAKLRKGWDEHFGYLTKQGYCVIVGEFGGYKDWPNNPVKPTAATIWAHLPTGVRYDWEWQNILVDYLKSNGTTDFTYWSINPESGDTGGIYNHAYSLSNESGWGVWQGLDTEKASMLGGLK